MTEVSIKVERLSKLYRISGKQERYVTMRDRLTESLGAPLRWISGSRREKAPAVRDFWALRDVSFEIGKGEVVGIIGRNGAGKSTLLKVLSKITEPTEGCATLRGRAACLLEVGSGFHPELSGRDNVYMNGAILGMRKQEIDRKFDEIVDFAETADFIDTPIKHYSSGMYMRLAFAVAAHLEAEILFIDEVLAVGDAAFQQKCLGKMQSIADHGRTVVFISHNLTAVATLCQKTLHLSAGQIVEYGPTPDVIERYLVPDAENSAFDRRLFPEDPHFELLDARISQDGSQTGPFVTSRPLQVEITYRIRVAVVGLRVGFDVLTHDGITLWRTWDDDMAGTAAVLRPAGDHKAVCTIPQDMFFPRSYIVSLCAGIQQTRWITHGSLQQSIHFYNSGGVGWAYADESHRSGLLMPGFPWTTSRMDS